MPDHPTNTESRPAPTAGHRPGNGTNRRRALLISAGAVIAALAVGGVAVAMSGGGQEAQGPGPSASAPAGPTADAESDNDTSSGDQTQPTQPPDERCTDQIQANERWVCLISARFDGTELVIDYEAEWAGSNPSTAGFHLHLYGGDGTVPSDAVMGSHAANRGLWHVEAQGSPLRFSADHPVVTEVVGDHPKVCARIADANHALVPSAGGGFTTGNCVPVQRSS
jgi:molecular chaperone DnaK